jgi:CBS domain containing-hemolysin-like protein
VGTDKNSPDSGQVDEPHEKDEKEQEKGGELQEKKEEGQEKNFWERIQTLLHLHRGPDTTEELEQEIQELLEEGEGQGLIGSLEEKLINRIFEFRDTLASEIMTPSAEIVSAEEKTSVAELIRIISEEGYTRIPVYRENQDHIIGILHAKDLLRICILKPDEPMVLEGFLNPPFFVSENKPIVDLLRDFQNRKTHMAIVTDEFGGVRGLVTLEDVIEEIVGEIDDEYDEDEHELRIVDEQAVIVKARIDIEDVEEFFQVALPEGPYESVGGLIIHKLGRVPRAGTVVMEGVLEFKVLSADPRRIKTVRIKRVDA